MAVIINYPVVEKPAPHFEGNAVGNALWNLLQLEQEGHILPELQFHLQGGRVLTRMKLVSSQCKVDECTGHVTVVARAATSCHCPCSLQRLHFVPDNGVAIEHDGLIVAMTVGYPSWEAWTVIENTHLKIRKTFKPDGSVETEDLNSKQPKDKVG
ncbi:hypothetical protein KKH39_02715 [Patescibacteria group bacterium]|nr:hypothetical protein [Patescibacteria group bacterium]